jgi:CubicO group peptidase (beta-lactamase class C family)
MKIFLVLLAIVSVNSVSAQEINPPADKRFAGIDSAFTRILSLWKGPGFAVAIVEKNKIVYAKGFGYRNLEEKLPVTVNTLFPIGSCTKSFSASLIGSLAAKGDIDINKPVRDYLPELKFYNDERNDRITIRDMLCHRTGLPRHDYSWYLFSTNSRDSLLMRTKYLEPSAHVGEKWQYNNYMYLAQGVLIEKLSHQTWETNITNNIFGPLGMTHSNLTIDDLEKNPDAAFGYVAKDSGKTIRLQKADYYHIDAMGPAGAINSNIMDMSNWLNTWIHGGTYNGKEIFPAGFAKEAMSAQMVSGPGLPEAAAPDIQFSTYGFGWMISSYRGHYRVEHGGNIDGFSATACFYPSDSVGIVVLTNQGNSAIPGIVRDLLTDRMLGLKYYDWNSYAWNSYAKMLQGLEEAKKAKINAEKPRRAVSHPLTEYTGLYNNKGYGTMDIYLERDSLFMRIGKNVGWLKPDQYDWFKIYQRDKEGRVVDTTQGFAIEFRTDANGDVNEINAAFEPSVKTLVFNRIPKAAPMTTPTARSTTLPRRMNCLKPLSMGWNLQNARRLIYGVQGG